jgi:hypothetical protein
MRHLTPAELVDLAESTRTDTESPHLRSCDVCRHRVAELRAAMAAVASGEGFEPSPLFWDRLSARVRETIEAERQGRAVSWWRLKPLWVGALAILMLAVAVFTRIERSPVGGPPVARTASAPLEPIDLFSAPDDPSLALVADLAAGLDWDAAREAGLTTDVGADGHLVSQLTEGELRALRDLLKGELSRPGA